MATAPHSADRVRPLELSDEALQEIRDVLRRGGDPSEVRPVLRQFCDEARKHQLPPEQLLVTFKTEVARIPEIRIPPDASMLKFVAQVVSLCIEEFYRPPT